MGKISINLFFIRFPHANSFGLMYDHSDCVSLPFQRHRYIEAFQVHCTLQKAEEDFISKNSVGEEDSFKIRSKSHWRTELVVSGLAFFMVTLQLPFLCGYELTNKE